MKPMRSLPLPRQGPSYPCYIQPRLAGIRALYQLGHFQSQAADKLKHLRKPLSGIFDAAIILDGALYVHGWPLEEIERAIAVDSDEIEYHVFDVVDFKRPFASRFMAPASILTDTQYLHKAMPVETHRLNSDALLPYYRNKWADYNGLIYRLGDGPYVPGLSMHLLHETRTITSKGPDERRRDPAAHAGPDDSPSPPAA
jgi:hypothetical protein